jgi:hypothetical protein
MGAKTDFWLALHNVCLCYEEEGDTLRERTGNVADAWASMPQSARAEMMRELRFLLAELAAVDANLMLRQTELQRELRGDGAAGHLVASNGKPASDGQPRRST